MKPELWQAVSKCPDASATSIPPAASISGLLPIISHCLAMLCYSLSARDDCRNAATFPLGNVCADVAEVPVSARASCWGEALAANHSTPIWCQQPARCHRLLPSWLIRGADPVRLEMGVEVCLLVRRILHVWLGRCVVPPPTPTLTLSPASCLICPTTSCMQIIISEGLRPVPLLHFRRYPSTYSVFSLAAGYSGSSVIHSSTFGWQRLEKHCCSWPSLFDFVVPQYLV